MQSNRSKKIAKNSGPKTDKRDRSKRGRLKA